MNIHETVWIAETAHVSGDVTLGAQCTVWPSAVIRGDENSITLGDRCNLQDGGIIHCGPDSPVTIGNDVSIAHGAIVHGCTIEDGAMIGMGAIVMDRARIGKGAFVAAGALVTEGTEVPAGMLAMGHPVKTLRPMKEAEHAYAAYASADYVRLLKSKQQESSQ